MRHQRAGRKLGRDSAHRKALYANLTASLIEHGRIKTTVAKAKEVRPVAEEMITLGRRGDVPARRQALTAAITTPPTVTVASARAKLTSKKRQRSHASVTSSNPTTTIAEMIAI